MEIDRRSFVSGLGAGFLTGLAPQAAEALTQGDVLFASPHRQPDETFAISIFDENGRVVLSAPLPSRGHAVAICESKGHFITFARRPDRFAMVLDVSRQSEPILIRAPEGRHYYGHGVYARDGALLYATEQDYEASTGLLGIYDTASGYERIGEIPTYGVGPHELIMSGDGRTLIVANGGIRTHPDTGREKLNIDTMQPNLALIDRETGDLIERLSLPEKLHQLSIRHLDVDAKGTVWFGCQHEGDLGDGPPLVGYVKPGGDLRLLSMPKSLSMRMQNYVGSVAVNDSTGVVATSGPRGDLVLFWDAASGALINEHILSDGCGLAAVGSGFVMSSGLGRLVNSDPDRLMPKDLEKFPGVAWDNHIARASEPITFQK